MPTMVRPMSATLIDKPFSGEDWLFEIKWDGYRAVAEIDDGTVKLHSRNLISFNERFYPLVDTLRTLPKKLILDGEIVAADREGKSHFQLLQNYQRTGQGNLIYYVFDILYFDQYDLTDLPLIRRKEILARILPSLPNVKLSEYIDDQGERFFAVAKAQGLEGVIGKRKSSPYHPGARSKDWVKIRNRLAAEAVIVGYTDPRGDRRFFGSLILGVHRDGELTYAVHAGAGFSDEDLTEIGAKLREDTVGSGPPTPDFPQSPSDRWVVPKLVAQIEFNGWTEKGLMRQPVFVGLREDKPAAEVTKATPQKFPRPSKKSTFEIDGQSVTITNPGKIFWPDEGYVKKNLIEYYEKIGPTILPYLKDRPLTLYRTPDGINGEGFYQKDVSGMHFPSWMETVGIPSASQGKVITYALCQNRASLLFLANLGCIEMHPWNSIMQALNDPNYLVIDLDPEEAAFVDVIKTALALRELLETLEIDSYPKTSGAGGMHIYIPLGAQYDYDQAKSFAEILSTLLNRKAPRITSLERRPAKRKGKVYPDFLQNLRGQTVAAPYSVRSEPGATVSAPLKWSEVTDRLSPDQFDIRTIFNRLERDGDLFAGVLRSGVDIKRALDKL